LKELYSRLSGKLVEKVHSTLGSEFGKDTAKIYKDYANFDEMAKTAIAETKGKQLPTSVSSLISRLGKPVTSTV
jgi:hypothetical protein